MIRISDVPARARLGARVCAVGLLISLGACSSTAARPAPLVLEQTIPLPRVTGRIDHLALDSAHGRLFIGALENGSVEVVDLAAGRVAGRINHLPGPQGVAVTRDGQQVAVATRSDGRVRFFRTDTLAAVGEVALGGEADNVRIDPAGQVVAGYGDGALAVIDPATRKVTRTVGLPAHPEGFQLDGGRAYVNLPDAGGVGVADLAGSAPLTMWPNRGRQWNFPMVFDPARQEVSVVYRLPARLVTFDARTGAERQAVDTCGDADDLFLDPRRGRIYVACGSGVVDVFVQGAKGASRLARIKTRPGARTAVFDAQGDRLYVAARAQGEAPAAILVFGPK